VVAITRNRIDRFQRRRSLRTSFLSRDKASRPARFGAVRSGRTRDRSGRRRLPGGLAGMA
jgi:hypothetical protein